jgi:hypothetical protein
MPNRRRPPRHDFQTKKAPHEAGANLKGYTVKRVHARRRRRNSNFDLPAKRRKEIVLIARDVGAAQTDDFDRYLIAWVWHNRKAKDQIWSVMEAAKRMGGKVTAAEASAITEEASITRKHLSADNLARFLGVAYAQRQALGLTTIGSVNVKKGARIELRKLRARRALAAKRHANGVRPRAEYEANSLSRSQPWRALGMSRRTWERHRNKARDASVSTASFLTTVDRPATAGMETGEFERGFASKEARGYPSSQTATTMAADIPISVVPCWVFGRRPIEPERRAA